jgi:invasion protein IalB
MVPAMQRVALSLALALLLAPSAPVVAQAPEIIKLGDAQGWEAYTDAGKGAKICYLIGKPAKSEPAGAKRSAIFASVTHRPGETRTNEVSFTSGYLFKEGSDADLAIDSKTFSLFTNKEGAWTRDAATDKAVVDALAKGKQAVIKGTSARGTEITDTYSLSGFSKAYQAIGAACKIQ